MIGPQNENVLIIFYSSTWLNVITCQGRQKTFRGGEAKNKRASKKIVLCGYLLAENIVAHLHAVVVDAQCVVVSIEHAYENTVQREMNE